VEIINLRKNEVFIGYVGTMGRKVKAGKTVTVTIADLNRRNSLELLKLDIQRGTVVIKSATTLEKALLSEAKIPSQAVSDDVIAKAKTYDPDKKVEEPAAEEVTEEAAPAEEPDAEVVTEEAAAEEPATEEVVEEESAAAEEVVADAPAPKKAPAKRRSLSRAKPKK